MHFTDIALLSAALSRHPILRSTLVLSQVG